MTNKDSLHRFIFDHIPIRGEFIHLQTSLQTILNQHPYPPAVKKLLSEALCVAGLLSAIIKFTGRLTVQFRGNGKLKLLLAQCDNHFHLRGLAKWAGDSLSYEDLMQSFNEGVLVILLDSGPKQARYQGIVSWQGNSLVASIENYFKCSEQLPTKIWLAANEKEAAGFLLQVAPGISNDMKNLSNEIIMPHWDHIIHRTANFNSQDLLMCDYETILRKLYPEEEIRIFPSVPIAFECTCSRQRGGEAILLLGREEAEEELKNNQVIVVTCDFCNQEYVFDRVDVRKLFEDKGNSSPSTQIH